MNIIEAVGSGRKFKRPEWSKYYSANQIVLVQLTSQDLLANDWEVEEKQVPITRSQFDKAWNIAHSETQFIHEDRREFAIYERLIEELGL
jgi:hypothetical protein